MQIIIKPCAGLDESEALMYAYSWLDVKEFDWKAAIKGRRNKIVMRYYDGTIAHLYETKTAYVVSFDSYKGGN